MCFTCWICANPYQHTKLTTLILYIILKDVALFDYRIGVTQRAIHEALGRVFNAMKEKEQELIGIVKESVAQKKAALSDCETKITETVTKYNGVSTCICIFLPLQSRYSVSCSVRLFCIAL